MTEAVDTTVVELMALEALRCRAISSGDLEVLDGLLDEGLTHTHVTGHTQTKAEYLAGLRRRPRQTSRSNLRVRVHGDTGTMTGSLQNVFPGQDPAGSSDITALQVWIRSGSSWKMIAFASSGRTAGP